MKKVFKVIKDIFFKVFGKAWWFIVAAVVFFVIAVTPAFNPGLYVYTQGIRNETDDGFLKEFYLHEQPFSSLASMTKSDWELRIKGRLFETGKKLNVTGFDELKQYITSELGGVMPQEVNNGYFE